MLCCGALQDFFERVGTMGDPGGVIFDMRERGWVTGGKATTAVQVSE